MDHVILQLQLPHKAHFSLYISHSQHFLKFCCVLKESGFDIDDNGSYFSRQFVSQRLSREVFKESPGIERNVRVILLHYSLWCPIPHMPWHTCTVKDDAMQRVTIMFSTCALKNMHTTYDTQEVGPCNHV